MNIYGVDPELARDALTRTIFLFNSEELAQIQCAQIASFGLLYESLGGRVRRALLRWRVDCEELLTAIALFDPASVQELEAIDGLSADADGAALILLWMLHQRLVAAAYRIMPTITAGIPMAA